MCGSSPSYPQPSAEEKELQSMQLQMLKEDRELTNLVTPAILAQSGWKMVTGEGGKKDIVKMTDEERRSYLTTEQAADEELIRKYQQRQLDALEGKLPISPAMEESITKQQGLLSATLAGRLGPGWATTTPGIQAMTQFNQAAELAREEARRGQIGQGSDILNQSMQLYQPGLRGGALSSVAPLGQMSGAIQGRVPGLLQPYQQQRMGQFQAGVAGAQGSSQMFGAGLGTLGLLGGIGLASYLAPAAPAVAVAA